MQHGIRADASSWQFTGDVLRAEYPVSPLRPGLNWRARYAQQSSDLRALLGAIPDTSAAVGHSSGGVVLRQSARDGLRLKGLLTVGSPNAGAPFAGNVRNGVVASWTSAFTGLAYWGVVSLAGWASDNYEAALIADLGATIWAAQTASGLTSLLGFDANYELWDEMRASGPYMQSVNNSGASVAAEGAAVAVRASLTTTVDPAQGWVPMQVAVPGNPGLATDIAVGGIWAGLIAASHFGRYCDGTIWERYNDPRCLGAYSALDLAVYLDRMQTTWCAMMQTEFPPGTNPWVQIDVCFPSDGVVPAGSQPIPSGPNIQLPGVSHTRQTASAAVRDRIGTFLSNSLGVARCGVGPAYRGTLAADSTILAIGDVVPLTVVPFDACEQATPNFVEPAQFASTAPAFLDVQPTGGVTGTMRGVHPGAATLDVRYRGGVHQRAVRVLAPPEIWSNDLQVSGCGETYCGSVTLSVGRVYSGARPVSIEWQIDGQPTGQVGPMFSGWFPQPAYVTAVLTNPAGGVNYLSYWVRGASGGEQPMRAPTERPHPVRGAPVPAQPSTRGRTP